MCNRIEITDDSQSRFKIETELNKNFFVEAGAGSGKTTELVNRMVAMVENGADISKICAITFTKAAAAEFYVRFQKKLAEKAGQNEYCKRALENIDLCFMGTIDSFCRMILTEHPMEAKIPADAKLLDENEMKSIYEKVYIDIRKGEYGPELKKKAELFKGYYWNDKDEFIFGLSYFMGRRNVHFNYDNSLLQNLDVDNKYARVRQDLINIFRTLSSHKEYAYVPYNGSRDPEWDNIDEIVKILSRRWSTNLRQVNRVLTIIHENIRLNKIPAGVDESYLDRQLNAWNKFDGFAFRGSFFKELRDLKYAISMDLLISTATRIESDLRESGCLCHFDYLYLLRNMLYEDSLTGGKLARHIFSRHSYFFLDEFQDTNPMQAEIFFYLCAQETKTNWRECIPAPGSLFIVGDPKQSIYKFRSADIGSYHKVKNLFTREVGEILYLRKNFRSRKVMAETYNTRFLSSFPENDTLHQCSYTTIEVQDNRVEDEHILEGVYTYDAFTGNKLLMSNPEMADEIQVANIIERIVHNEDYKVLKSGETEPHTIDYDDIMVITYSKNRLGDFIRVFADRGIPCKTEGKVMFADCPGLHMMLALMRVLADPYNRAAVTSMLKSRIKGFTDQDILHFVSKYCGGRPIDIMNGEYEVPESDATSYQMAELLKMIRGMYLESSLLSPAAIFMMVMERMEIFSLSGSDQLEIFYYVLELIKSEQASGKIVTAGDCADYIEYLLAGNSDQERCLSLMNDTNRVHLANLHKVKGLEAPVVFLTYWYPMNEVPGVYVDYSGDNPEGYVVNLSESTGSKPIIHFSTDEFADAKRNDVAALNAEKMRLIYVGATRARHALFVCNSHSGKVGTIRSTWIRVVTSDSTPHSEQFITGSGNGINQTVIRQAAADLYQEGRDSNALNDRDIENNTYELRTPSSIKVGDRLSDSEVTAGAEATAKTDNEANVTETASNLSAGVSVSTINEADRKAVKKYPNYLGTMVHKLMEMMVSAASEINSRQYVSQILEQYINKALEPVRDNFERVLLSIAEQIESGGYPQTNGAPQNILKVLREADEVYCEVPFTYMKGSELWNGEMDVVYRSGDNWHIIDYKTNADADNLDLEYAGQLAEYVSAFKTITDNDADALTYHIEV